MRRVGRAVTALHLLQACWPASAGGYHPASYYGYGHDHGLHHDHESEPEHLSLAYPEGWYWSKKDHDCVATCDGFHLTCGRRDETMMNHITSYAEVAEVVFSAPIHWAHEGVGPQIGRGGTATAQPSAPFLSDDSVHGAGVLHFKLLNSWTNTPVVPTTCSAVRKQRARTHTHAARPHARSPARTRTRARAKCTHSHTPLPPPLKHNCESETLPHASLPPGPQRTSLSHLPLFAAPAVPFSAPFALASADADITLPSPTLPSVAHTAAAVPTRAHATAALPPAGRSDVGYSILRR